MDPLKQKIEIIKYHTIEFYYFAFSFLLHGRILIPIALIMFIMSPSVTSRYEFPIFRVVIDPGHGGIGKNPMSVHGDRYDTVFNRYLDFFKEGAARGSLREGNIVYNIARKTEKILKLLAPGGNNKKFYRLLEKYTDGNPLKLAIITNMSRDRSITEDEAGAV